MDIVLGILTVLIVLSVALSLALLSLLLWTEVVNSMTQLKEKKERRQWKKDLFASIKKAKKQLEKYGGKADTVILNIEKFEWFYSSNIYGMRVKWDNLSDEVDFLLRDTEESER